MVWPASRSASVSPMHTTACMPLSTTCLALLAVSASVSFQMVRRSLWPHSAQPTPISRACSTLCEPVKAPSARTECTSWIATPTSARSAALTDSMCSAEGATTTSARAGSAPMALSTATCAVTVAFEAAALKFPPIQQRLSDISTLVACERKRGRTIEAVKA